MSRGTGRARTEEAGRHMLVPEDRIDEYGPETMRVRGMLLGASRHDAERTTGTQADDWRVTERWPIPGAGTDVPVPVAVAAHPRSGVLVIVPEGTGTEGRERTAKAANAALKDGLGGGEGEYRIRVLDAGALAGLLERDRTGDGEWRMPEGKCEKAMRTMTALPGRGKGWTREGEWMAVGIALGRHRDLDPATLGGTAGEARYAGHVLRAVHDVRMGITQGHVEAPRCESELGGKGSFALLVREAMDGWSMERNVTVGAETDWAEVQEHERQAVEPRGTMGHAEAQWQSDPASEICGPVAEAWEYRALDGERSDLEMAAHWYGAQWVAAEAQGQADVAQLAADRMLSCRIRGAFGPGDAGEAGRWAWKRLEGGEELHHEVLAAMAQHHAATVRYDQGYAGDDAKQLWARANREGGCGRYMVMMAATGGSVDDVAGAIGGRVPPARGGGERGREVGAGRGRLEGGAHGARRAEDAREPQGGA